MRDPRVAGVGLRQDMPIEEMEEKLRTALTVTHAIDLGGLRTDLLRVGRPSGRQGRAMPVYPHPELRPALRETFGVIVYHEQVIRVIAAIEQNLPIVV